MNGGTVTFDFKGDTKDLEQKTEQISTSVGDIIKGSLAAKGISKAIGIINENLDGAIKRVDQLNQFPKVMNSLGISSEDASEAMDMINESILGLPTTLNQATAAVQRFTAKNEDVKKSSKYFTAINDALLSGTNDSQLYSSALEQIMQSYAKGKPDLMEWRSLVTAMPAQLKAVANAMGFASSDDLYEGFKDGKVTMDEFMDTLVRLDTEGAPGIEAFNKSVRSSTGGIETSMTNLRTAITRGIANSITAIDSAMQEQGLGSISENIQKLSSGISNAFKSIDWNSLIKNIKNLMPLIIGLAGAIGTFKGLVKIATGVNAISKSISSLSTGIKLIKGIPTTIKGISVAFKALGAAMATNPIGLIITLIAGLVAAFIYLWNTSDSFRNFWIDLWNSIKDFFINAWNAIIGFFTTTIPAVFNNFISFLQSIPSRIGEFITSIINWFSELPTNIGYAIGSVIGTLIKFYTQDIPNFIVGLFQQLGEILPQVWELIKNVGIAILTLPYKLIELKVQLIQKAWEIIQNLWNYLSGAIPNLVNAIVSWFRELPGRMVEIGRQIVNGIWQGIQGAAGAFKRNVDNFFSGVVSGVKNKLGIHSPSKVFMEIGGYMDKGLIEGIDNMKAKVQDSINGIVNVSPSVYGSATNNLSPVINVSNNVNVSQDPLGQMVSQIKTFSGGAKNDYNYGMGV